MYLKLCFLPPQALMRDAEKTPNVVKACNKPRLYDELEDIQKRYSFFVLFFQRVLRLIV